MPISSVTPYAPDLIQKSGAILSMAKLSIPQMSGDTDADGYSFAYQPISGSSLESGAFNLKSIIEDVINNDKYEQNILLAHLRTGILIYLYMTRPQSSAFKVEAVHIRYQEYGGTPVNFFSRTIRVRNEYTIESFYFLFFEFLSTRGFGFWYKTSDDSKPLLNGVTGSQEEAKINLLLNGNLKPDDPYGLDENETPPGGYGSFDYTSEDETPPALPSLSAANAGFVTLWNPTISEVGDLADYLWGPTFSVATWQKLWNDPMECLLSLGIVPVTPTTGTRANIFFGNADTGIESTPITTQFVTVDMGSIHISGQSASYMDYAPYAKASIYLPYCGTYALDVDEIMDADLALEYHIDIYTGACVAYLTINNRTNSDGSNVHNIMYQFTGNCLASIPVTSGDHSQLLQSLLFMGASIATTVATAGAGAASGGAIEGLAAEGDVVASSGVLGAATAGSAINTVMSMKPNVVHSGNLSSTAGLLGGQKPYVTFTWSNLCRPEDEYQLVGMPIQKSGTLSDFEGFTIVSACHMDNILCTDAERSMIEQALGRGVII